MQDNKHTSKKAKLFCQASGINWWPTPPESHDLNPSGMKLRCEVNYKPMNEQQLIGGIEEFWSTVDSAKCYRYIEHIRKVIPKVIDCQSNAIVATRFGTVFYSCIPCKFKGGFLIELWSIVYNLSTHSVHSSYSTRVVF